MTEEYAASVSSYLEENVRGYFWFYRNKSDWKDALQDIMLQLIEFEDRGGKIPEDWKPYVKSVARNYKFAIFRVAQKRKADLCDIEDHPNVTPTESGERCAIRNALLRYIRQQLRALPNRQQAIIRAFYLEGKSLRDIAANERIGRDWVQQAKAQGLSMLRSLCGS